MRCSYYPQSLVRNRGANRRSGVGFGGVDPRVLFITSYPGVTSVCLVWDLPRVNCLTRVSLGRVVAGKFLAVLEVFCLDL
jgi:hypothetical protein